MSVRVEVTWRGDQWDARFAQARDAALTTMAAKAADFADREMGRDHGGVRSKPGEPPNVQTGHLSRSITFCSPQALGTPGQSAFGTNVRYGRFLEFGTVKMAPRPWMMRAVRLNRDALQRAFAVAFRRRMGGGNG